MNPQLLTALIALAGFVGNAIWSWFNARWEKRTLEHIDGLKEWIRNEYYDQRYINQLQHQLEDRMTRAGA